VPRRASSSARDRERAAQGHARAEGSEGARERGGGERKDRHLSHDQVGNGNSRRRLPRSLPLLNPAIVTPVHPFLPSQPIPSAWDRLATCPAINRPSIHSLALLPFPPKRRRLGQSKQSWQGCCCFVGSTGKYGGRCCCCCCCCRRRRRRRRRNIHHVCSNGGGFRGRVERIERRWPGKGSGL